MLWQKRRIRDLGTRLQPNALNNEGLVVGYCHGYACVLEDGRLTQLAPSEDGAEAVDVNNRRQIVGSVTDACGGDCSLMNYVYLWSWVPG